ncbi:RNA polymerase sigma factor [Streptomyces adustus]|uniref:RNA polymerase sigma factor n=1 Tax=Streptomyces adustus TaxID=1609272 RepID=UPI0037248C6E
MELIQEQEPARSREQRYEALARVVAQPLHRYLRRRADADQVDDILAESMLVLWRRLEDVPGLDGGPVPAADEVLPWCYGVARRCLSNARRADSRRLGLVERLTRAAAVPAVQPQYGEHEQLHAALSALGATDREVVLLWAWEELAPRAIAEVTGLSANAVSIRLHRAKKKLAVLLEGKNGLPAGHETADGRSTR